MRKCSQNKMSCNSFTVCVHQLPAKQKSRLMQVSSWCISYQLSNSLGSCRSALGVAVTNSATVQAHAGQLMVYQFPAQQQSRLMQVSSGCISSLLSSSPGSCRSVLEPNQINARGSKLAISKNIYFRYPYRRQV